MILKFFVTYINNKIYGFDSNFNYIYFNFFPFTNNSIFIISLQNNLISKYIKLLISLNKNLIKRHLYIIIQYYKIFRFSFN